MAYSETAYEIGRTAGVEVQPGPQSENIDIVESALTHPTHSDGFVDAGDPVLFGSHGVGVATRSAAAATEMVAVCCTGIWDLNVTASDEHGTSAVVFGDQLYISSAGVISKITTGRPFGVAMAAMSASASAAVGPVLVGKRWDDLFLVSTNRAATGLTNGIFIAPASCTLLEVRESHGTVAAATCTFQAEKCAATETPGNGTDMLAAALNGESTINTPVKQKALTTAAATMAAGEVLRIAQASGAATGYADGTWTFVFIRN